jgi:cytochrome P450
VNELMKVTRDPKVMKNEMLNILLAGRDSMASLMSYTFHVLVRRPDILAKLKKEVEGLERRTPNWEDLKRMGYLKNVLTESISSPQPRLASTSL